MKAIRFALLSFVVAAVGTLTSGVATRIARAATVFTVTNTNDSGPGSLRQAVLDAHDFDEIIFNLPPHSTITLTSGEIAISVALTILGPGANQLTISGNNSSRIFDISDTAKVAIAGLTMANGFVQGIGGGIDNRGELSVAYCIFTGNSLGQGQLAGGALASGGALAVTGCAFLGNSAPSAGAVYSNDSLCTITNSTFSGNSATIGAAGAINLSGNANVIVNCTISGNSTTFSGFGGGIFVVTKESLSLENTIIAGNTGGDCSIAQGVLFASNSHNLIGDGTCSPMLSGDPKLGPLQNNGGPTPTMALLPGSPAIDAGDDSALGAPLSLTTDQRGIGFPRKAGAHVDIGAFEVQPLSGPSFDTCLKDNSTSNLIQWNSTTGQYKFTRCSDGFMLTGTGAVALVNGIRTLTDFKSDRRIKAGFNTGQLTGSATIYLQVTQGVWQLFQIYDTDPHAVCNC